MEKRALKHLLTISLVLSFILFLLLYLIYTHLIRDFSNLKEKRKCFYVYLTNFSNFVTKTYYSILIINDKFNGSKMENKIKIDSSIF